MKKTLVLLAVLSGCMLPTESTLPPLEIDECWKGGDESINEYLTDCWWTEFHDETLDALEERALSANPDLWIACERIQEARAIEGIAFSDRLPNVNASPSWNKEGLLFNPNQVTGKDIPNLGLTRVIQETYAFPLNLSYEFDFWGKYCYADKAAQERLISTEFGYLSVVNILTTEVARVYFNLRSLDEEIQYLKNVVGIRNVFVDINKKRVQGGMDPEVDLERARLELQLAEGDLLNAVRLRRLAENELAVLMGQQASTFCVAPGTLPDSLLNVCPGLPSELLLRRPDLNEQYRKIKAFFYDVGVANANFFPAITLTSALGTVSPLLSSWFTWQSRYWAFAFSAIQQIFDGGRLCNEKDLTLARFRKEKAFYQKMVYTAFKEVEDALSDIHYRREQYEVQQFASKHATLTAHLARQQFDGGLINYLQVADAEKTELDVKRKTIQMKGYAFAASVALIKALGGAPSNTVCE